MSSIRAQSPAIVELERRYADDPEKLQKHILKQIRSKQADKRAEALAYAVGFADSSFYADLIELAVKSKPEQQKVLFDWVAAEAEVPAKQRILRRVEVRFDMTAHSAMTHALRKIHNPAAKASLAWALTEIADKRTIPILAELLQSEVYSDIELGVEVLTAFDGDVTGSVARVMQSATEEGTIAALGILAQKHADAQLNRVLQQTKSEYSSVRMTAYETLQYVVVAKDFTMLCGMMETSKSDYVLPLQSAIMATLSDLPVEKQREQLERRALLAGSQMRFLYSPMFERLK